MPASPSEISGTTLAKCDFVNLVIEPGNESQRRVSSNVALLARLGVDQKRIGIVVVDRSGKGISIEVSPSASINGRPIMGIVPFDAEKCTDAEERGIPIVLAAPSSSVAVALRKLAKTLINLE
ncbi:hypothetical protein ACFLXE_01820 [Chloroflexota bacterium]